jgi:hypothetical protein
MKTIRLRTLMVVIAVIGCALALINEGIIYYARSWHVGYHEDRARWFASQAEAYRGNQPGVREESLRLADSHRKRADEYRRSRKYDHEIEIIQDSRQMERENPVDRLLVIDRNARRAAARTSACANATR